MNENFRDKNSHGDTETQSVAGTQSDKLPNQTSPEKNILEQEQKMSFGIPRPRASARENWKRVKLGEVCKQIRGVSYSPNDLGEESTQTFSLLRANNIQSPRLDFSEVVFVNRERVKEDQVLLRGDILICASSGSKELVGKAALFDGDGAYTFGAFCKVLRPLKTVNAQYLGHFFQSPFYRQTISGLSAGANINNLRSEHLDGLFIPLPPLEVQKRIAGTLDKVWELIDLRERELVKFDELVKCRFIEMFEKDSLPRISFGDVCIFLRNGANIKQSKYAQGIPITRIETLSGDKFNLDRLGYANITEVGKYKSYLLHEGDILISHINSLAYLGRAVRYKGEVEGPIIHGMNLLCARIKPDFAPCYIEFCFKTAEIKKQIERITKKAVNQASITVSDLKNISVPVPPLSLQEEFARFVGQVDKSKFSVARWIFWAERFVIRSVLLKFGA